MDIVMEERVMVTVMMEVIATVARMENAVRSCKECFFTSLPTLLVVLVLSSAPSSCNSLAGLLLTLSVPSS